MEPGGERIAGFSVHRGRGAVQASMLPSPWRRGVSDFTRSHSLSDSSSCRCRHSRGTQDVPLRLSSIVHSVGPQGHTQAQHTGSCHSAESAHLGHSEARPAEGPLRSSLFCVRSQIRCLTRGNLRAPGPVPALLLPRGSIRPGAPSLSALSEVAHGGGLWGEYNHCLSARLPGRLALFPPGPETAGQMGSELQRDEPSGQDGAGSPAAPSESPQAPPGDRFRHRSSVREMAVRGG